MVKLKRMANFFTTAFKGAINPSTYTRGDNKVNGSIFYAIGSFFGYDFGTKGFRNYLNAFAKNALVYMIVHRISTSSASLPVLYTDYNDKELTNSEIEILLDKPNKDQGYQEFIEEAIEYLLITGNLMIHHEEGIGMGEELRCLNSSRMKLVLDSLGFPIRWKYLNNMNKEESFELDEILHIKTSNIVDVTGSGIYYGISPLEASWNIIKSSDEIFEAEAAIFKNRGVIGILSNESDTPLLEPDRKRIQESFNEEVGGADRMNQIKISNTKLKFIQTSMAPSDLKLLEGIINKLRLLCAVYGLSSVLFNDNENSTYNNVQEAERGAHINVYIPVANKVLHKISDWISEKKRIQVRATVDKKNVEAIRMTANEVINTINTMNPSVATRIVSSMTRNQALDILGLPKLPEPQGSELVGDGKVIMEQIQNNA